MSSFLQDDVPELTSAQGVAADFRGYKGHRFASTKEAVAMSEGFRRQVFDFAERHGIPIIRFEKGMREDDVMHKRLRKFKAPRASSLSASPRRRLACRAPSANASGRRRFFRKWLAALPNPYPCGRLKGRLSLPALGVAGGVFASLRFGIARGMGGSFSRR